MGKEAARVENSLLPQTRSELALPLISRSEAMGTLNIQSGQETALTEEDIALLQVTAGQIAHSIENVRLYRQSEAALEALENIYRRYFAAGVEPSPW